MPLAIFVVVVWATEELGPAGGMDGWGPVGAFLVDAVDTNGKMSWSVAYVADVITYWWRLSHDKGLQACLTNLALDRC